MRQWLTIGWQALLLVLSFIVTVTCVVDVAVGRAAWWVYLIGGANLWAVGYWWREIRQTWGRP